MSELFSNSLFASHLKRPLSGYSNERLNISAGSNGSERQGISHFVQIVCVAMMILWPSLLEATHPLAMPPRASANSLKAGAAKIDITNRHVPLVNDPLFAKALVLSDGNSTVVLITVDAVAIAQIGTIRNDFLANVRKELQTKLAIAPENVLINASHCHGVVCDEIEQRTVEVVIQAHQAMEEVRAGTGTGFENRIMENRRLILKDGKEADVRHAYSLPADAEVAAVGPTDPEIGILKLVRNNGEPLALVYNFAVHPIQGVPNGGNTADLTGFASKVIEENLGSNCTAFFVQGCAGDINPVQYKDVENPRNAETLGNMLGLSVLQGSRGIKPESDNTLRLIHETMELPRSDLTVRIEELKAEQTRMLQSLQGTSLNLKTFLPLVVKYKLDEEYPSYASHRYLHEKQQGKNDLIRLDQENRRNMELYMKNIAIMEKLTRLQTNLDLLKMHQAQHLAAPKRTIDVEINLLRVGDFRLITFPGELTVQIGLNIKAQSPFEATFVAGYTNGYIYYAPTAQQLKNLGGAQEDSDCLLAPEWQALFEDKVKAMLSVGSP